MPILRRWDESEDEQRPPVRPQRAGVWRYDDESDGDASQSDAATGFLGLNGWENKGSTRSGIFDFPYLSVILCVNLFPSTHPLPISISGILAKTPMRSALAGLGSLQKLI